MENNYCVQVRVTGVLIEGDQILIVKQRISDDRSWSLPGGRVEKGESLKYSIIREMREETGLETKISKFLYLCEKPESDSHIIHVTFLLKKTGGEICLPSNEFDENPIYDVKMVNIEELIQYDFSIEFMNMVKNNFPNSGNYMGHKRSIGL